MPEIIMQPIEAIEGMDAHNPKECGICFDLSDHKMYRLPCCFKEIHECCLHELYRNDFTLCPFCRQDLDYGPMDNYVIKMTPEVGQEYVTNCCGWDARASFIIVLSFLTGSFVFVGILYSLFKPAVNKN